MYDFRGKVALVTGASHKYGLGRGIALRLAREGADVAVTRSHFPEKPRENERREGWRGLDSVVEEIQALGRQALGITVDIAKAEEVDRMAKEVLARFGKIDILVNNAATVGKRGIPILEIEERDWRLPIDVNLTGTFLCSKAVAREMVKRGQGGRIINIVSMEAKLTLSGDRAPYIASKSGLIGFVQALALELAPHKINVNGICPSATNTGILADHLAGEAKKTGVSAEQFITEYYQRFVSMVPLGRLGTPEEIAGPVAFLASPDADYITGQVIMVNGGLFMEH